MNKPHEGQKATGKVSRPERLCVYSPAWTGQHENLVAQPHTFYQTSRAPLTLPSANGAFHSRLSQCYDASCSTDKLPCYLMAKSQVIFKSRIRSFRTRFYRPSFSLYSRPLSSPSHGFGSGRHCLCRRPERLRFWPGPQLDLRAASGAHTL